MRYTELISEVSETSGVSSDIVKNVFEMLVLHLNFAVSEGDRVTMKNLGHFHPSYAKTKGASGKDTDGAVMKLGFTPSNSFQVKLERGEDESAAEIASLREAGFRKTLPLKEAN